MNEQKASNAEIKGRENGERKKTLKSEPWVQGSTAPWATQSWRAMLLGTSRRSSPHKEQQSKKNINCNGPSSDWLWHSYGCTVCFFLFLKNDGYGNFGSRSTQPVSAGTRQGYHPLRHLSFVALSFILHFLTHLLNEPKNMCGKHIGFPMESKTKEK